MTGEEIMRAIAALEGLARDMERMAATQRQEEGFFRALDVIQASVEAMRKMHMELEITRTLNERYEQIVNRMHGILSDDGK